MSMRPLSRLPLSLAGLLLAPLAAHAQTTFFGPLPYTSTADRPAEFAPIGFEIHVEDAEDGAIDARLSVNASVIGPGGLTDSVDADDGNIDGSGSNGRSLFAGAPVVVTFSSPLPVAAGLVWTDGGTPTSATFEAFDAGGVSLGTLGPIAIGDLSNLGGTDEDRFFGIAHAAGISRIRISHTSGGYEVDHITWVTLSDGIFSDGFEAP